jgi:hypothetical protein
MKENYQIFSTGNPKLEKAESGTLGGGSAASRDKTNVVNPAFMKENYQFFSTGNPKLKKPDNSSLGGGYVAPRDETKVADPLIDENLLHQLQTN